MNMTKRQRRLIVIAVVAAGVLAGVGIGVFTIGSKRGGVPIKVYPPDTTDARLIEADDGTLIYQARNGDGEWVDMTPQAFAQGVWANHNAQDFGHRVLVRTLNISSTATIGWVLLGLLGQVLFAGRMVVQWLASEKAKQSIVPNAFWWMALGGASMLLIYFVWRKDIVGVIGQSTGWAIYTRNLYFIYIRPWKKRRQEARRAEEAALVGATPEADESQDTPDAEQPQEPGPATSPTGG